MKASDVVTSPLFHLTIATLRQFCQMLERVDLCRIDAMLTELEQENPQLFNAMSKDIKIVRECHNLLHALHDKEFEQVVKMPKHQEIH